MSMGQLRLSLLLMSAKTYTFQSPLVTAIKPAFHGALSHCHVNNTDKRTQHASYFLIPLQSPAPSVRPTILPNSLKTHIKTASKSERPRQQALKGMVCESTHPQPSNSSANTKVLGDLLPASAERSGNWINESHTVGPNSSQLTSKLLCVWVL